MATAVFTQTSQISFLIQFVITFIVSAYLYTKYKNDWMTFEKFFFLFFALITTSNFIAIFYIIASGLPYAFVIVLSNSALIALLMAGETLMGVHNIYLLYVIPIAVFVFDTVVNIVYALAYIDEVPYRIITGIDILFFTIPALLIFAYLTYKTKDISLGFFVLALLLYLAGGFSLSSYGEESMAVFYILAVICFVIATVLPIVRNRLQSLSPDKTTTG